MICPYCKKENQDQAQICDFCGGPLSAPSVEKLSPVIPPESPGDHETAPLIPQASRAERIQASPPPAGGIYRNKVWWFVCSFLLLFLIVGCVAVGWSIYHFTNGFAFLYPPTITATQAETPVSVIASSPTTSPTKIVNTSTPIKTTIPTTAPTRIPAIITQPAITFTINPSLSNPKLIFFDDFSDPSSGWDQVHQANFYSDYYNGAYRIIVYSDMSDSWANPDDNIFGDVIIEVDATKNDGPDENDFGVICRYQGLDQFYYAVITSDGYYGISKVASDTSIVLGRDYLAFSNLINQGFATNHIRFDCIGEELTLYVNSQQLDQQSDDTYSYGNVGLIAGTYDTPGVDILFDNFSVSQP